MEVIHRQAKGLNEVPLARTFLNAVQNYLLVLNAQRQIVMASENVLELTPGKTMDQIVGLRPGEALGCIYAHDCASGCGTSEFCRQCGTVKVILAGLAGSRCMQECNLTRVAEGRQETLQLLVLGTPLVHNQERFTLLAISNITHEKQ